MKLTQEKIDAILHYTQECCTKTVFAIIGVGSTGANDDKTCVTAFLIKQAEFADLEKMQVICENHQGTAAVKNIQNSRLFEGRLRKAGVAFEKRLIKGKAYADYAKSGNGKRNREMEKAICLILGYQWIGGLLNSEGGKNRDGVDAKGIKSEEEHYLEVKCNRGFMELG